MRCCRRSHHRRYAAMPSCSAPSRPCSRSTPESELDGVLGWQKQMLSPPLSAASHTRSIAIAASWSRAAIRGQTWRDWGARVWAQHSTHAGGGPFRLADLDLGLVSALPPGVNAVLYGQYQRESSAEHAWTSRLDLRLRSSLVAMSVGRGSGSCRAFRVGSDAPTAAATALSCGKRLRPPRARHLR